jgi:anti-sigma regulatory factor (Ser/Thr protein kinase)
VGYKSPIAEPRYARTVLPPVPTSAGAARRFLRDRLNDWGYPLALAEVPCLLVSELVTNAIVHTGTPVELALRLAGRRLRSAVADGSSRTPVPRQPGANAETGRGLKLVEELAEEWGVESTGRGKTVWFEVDLAARDRLLWRPDRA